MGPSANDPLPAHVVQGRPIMASCVRVITVCAFAATPLAMAACSSSINGTGEPEATPPGSSSVAKHATGSSPAASAPTHGADAGAADAGSGATDAADARIAGPGFSIVFNGQPGVPSYVTLSVQQTHTLADLHFTHPALDGV